MRTNNVFFLFQAQRSPVDSVGRLEKGFETFGRFPYLWRDVLLLSLAHRLGHALRCGGGPSAAEGAAVLARALVDAVLYPGLVIVGMNDVCNRPRCRCRR